MKKHEIPLLGPSKRCRSVISRRIFLKQCGSLVTSAGAGLALAGSQPCKLSSPGEEAKVKVGLVSVTAPSDWNVWPYVNFDYETRNAT